MFDLKESDLPELERLAEDGYKWIARDYDGAAYVYVIKPTKSTSGCVWDGEFGFEDVNIRRDLLHHNNPEPLNIAAAIEQIKAGMKERSATEIPATDITVSAKPLTRHAALLEKMNDVREMAKLTIGYSDETMTYSYHVSEGSCMIETEEYDNAIEHEIAYLESEAADD